VTLVAELARNMLELIPGVSVRARISDHNVINRLC